MEQEMLPHGSVLSHIASKRSSLPPVLVETGVHGPAELLPRSQLLGLAGSSARHFRTLGVQPKDRIATFLPTGRTLLQCILGAWAAGAMNCVLSPGLNEGRSSLSLDRVRTMLRVATPLIIVATGDDLKLLEPIAKEFGAKLIDIFELPTEPDVSTPLFENSSDAPALIQFTSGSTGIPKAVIIEHGQLVDNARAIADRTGFGRDDCFASWLPLHHDFGFVVGFCMPLLCDARLVLIPSETFSKNPLNWLKIMAEQKASFSGSPSSGVALLCKPMFASKSANFDLSSLRRIWIGAEPVASGLCDDFERIYSKAGLKGEVLSAAYGMAETTLAVSVGRETDKRNITWIDAMKFRREAKVVFTPPNAAGAISLLSNGVPISGVSVRILDEDGHDLNEGEQGRIVVSSSMVAKRFFGSNENPQPNGWLDTGDLGFLLRGEVYVTGRSKDVIIKNGVNMPAHMIEDAVIARFPEAINRAVAFSFPSERDLRDEVVVGVEVKRQPTDASFETAVRTAIHEEIDFPVDIVAILPKGSIPRTTSGKIQRAYARELFRRGQLALNRSVSAV